MQSLRIIFALVVAGPLFVEPALAQQSVQDNARARAKQLDQQREEERKRGLEKRFPVGMRWVLEDMGGKRPPAGVDAALRIDASYRAAGSAGCNTFSSAMYPAKEQTLMASTPALTRRTCAAPIMAFERAFLQTLYSRPKWDQVGDTLILKSRAGVLRFRRGL